MLELVFWTCFAVLGWTYVGYPALMLIRARLRGTPAVRPGGRAVKVTTVVAVRNGGDRLRARVENLLGQAYPPELLDVIVVLNGCTDGSEAVAAELAAGSDRVRALESPAEEGKAGALNRGVAETGAEVVVFTDVRQRFRPDAIQRLVDAVTRPGVGAVSGRLLIGEGETAAVRGMGRYWSFETELRRAESRTGSVVGVTGAIWAVRRSLYRPIPPGTILDDVYEPLRLALDGHRIGFEPASVATDEPSEDTASEYRRRVRTLVGNLQLLSLLPDLLHPGRNPLFARFLSHKLLRVMSPFFLLGLLATGLVVAQGAYLAAGLAGLAVIVLGLVGMVVHVRPLALPAAFVMIQVAAVEAVLRRRQAAADVWTS